MVEKLFSYGTLRYPAVQRATFGRTLSGANDVLPGYRLDRITIADAHVLAISKESEHPILRVSNNPNDRVPGTVFDVTLEELALSDSYEVADYKRAKVMLQSGIHAWVYVSSKD